MIEGKMLIDGEWLDCGGAKTIDVINPYSGKKIGTVPEASREDFDRAVEAAQKAFASFRHAPAHERAAILERACQKIKDHEEELAETISRESGKAFKFALIEVRRCQDTFKTAAEEAKRIHGETVPLDAVASGVGRFGFFVRCPVGVVGAIAPWNFPINLVAHKVAPAIAAGNTIVLKPASYTPFTAVRLAEILTDVGLPPGVLNVVFGPGGTVGEWIAADPRIAKVTFTGSAEVGKRITQIAGLKKVTLELGNNSGAIVDEGADLEALVPSCVASAYACAGQMCVSLQQLWVHRSLEERAAEMLAKSASALKVGDPCDRSVDVGSMVTEKEAQRVEEWVNEAVSQGARIRAGGRREGACYYPTVLDQVRPEMRVVSQEVFGPLVSVLGFDRIEEAIDALNSGPYGLQVGVFTPDLKRAFQCIDALEFGGVMINDVPSYRADHMPYGGVKESGLGREGVRYAVEEMTYIKMVGIKLA